jgi:hypothetical protein
MSFAANATGRVTYGPLDPKASVEDRLTILDQRLRESVDRFNNALENLRANQHDLGVQLTDSQRAANDRISEAEERLARHATGDLRLSAWSVVMILLGTVLLTAAAVVAVTAAVSCPIA